MLAFVLIGVTLFHRTLPLSDCEFEIWRNGMEGSAPDMVRSSMGTLVEEFFPCAALAEDKNCEGGGLYTVVNAARADLSRIGTKVRATLKVEGV